jgi:hypothetical protein
MSPRFAKAKSLLGLFWDVVTVVGSDDEPEDDTPETERSPRALDTEGETVEEPEQ